MQARYFDLYDLAPVSYCTVNEAGIILEANLATAELLNQTRKSLVGQRISRYIHKDFQDVYYLSRKRLLATGLLQHCELHMVRADAGDQSYSYEGEGTTLWVNATIASAKDSSENLVQRIVLTDITNDKIMALAMQKSEAKLRAIVDSHA
jgi:PAS domain S-box-containing protein